MPEKMSIEANDGDGHCNDEQEKRLVTAVDLRETGSRNSENWV